MDWKEEAIAHSKQWRSETGINWNPDFSFPKWAVEQGGHYSPTHSERRFVAKDGKPVTVQGFADLAGEGPDTYLMYRGTWSGMGNVVITTEEDLEPEPGIVDTWASPVERNSTNIWGEGWYDANAYLNRYSFGNPTRTAVHTGADINMANDADKGKPVWAVANGTVTFARLVPNSTWGRLVVIRHTKPDGQIVHSRYGHLATFAVPEGDFVRRGQQIGTIGGIEYGVANHVHFDIGLTGILESNPTHWPGDTFAGVLEHYVAPRPFLLNQGQAEWTPAIDVSHHQNVMDWQRAYAAGARLALIRATRGVTVDTQWDRNRKEAPASGMSVIPWHFWQEGAGSAAEQVAQLLKHADGYRAYGVDAEITSLYPDPNPNAVYNFIQGLRKRRPEARVLLYTNLQWLNTVRSDHPIHGVCDLWLAHWGVQKPRIPAGWSDWRIWQYTVSDAGPFWGAGSPRIDLDYFRGTLDEVRAYAGGPGDVL